MKKITVILAASVAMTAAVYASNSQYLSKVYEFVPAPGQFINVYPSATESDSAESVIATIESTLLSGATSGLVSLGGYGGYIVVGFDHSVVNVAGEYDFIIYGNAGTGGAEPGIVEVMVDENGNGLPDDTWYELAGSEYNSTGTVKNYEITYYKPADDKEPETDSSNSVITDLTYIKWTTNCEDDSAGYVMKNAYHTQAYWPYWIEDTVLTFKGTRLAQNYTVSSGIYTLAAYDWGYVDNVPTSKDTGMNIEWAVDSAGNSVSLSQIDFIKVYTALNQYCGWLGETSTEIRGGEDLHPDATVTTGIIGTLAEESVVNVSSNGDNLNITASTGFTAQIYSVSGQLVRVVSVEEGTNSIDIADLARGMYVIETPAKCYKFIR